MSTRSQIRYRNSENNILIYKHSDGYPSGVLPLLIPFVEDFFKSRGDDECYFLAQCIRHFAVEDFKRETEKDGDDSVFATPYRFLGWGLDCAQHGDVDYLYEVDDKGNIFVNNKKLTKEELTKWKGTELYA